MKINFYNLISIIFGLFMLKAGLNKFFEFMPFKGELAPEFIAQMQAMERICWLLPLVGLAEIIGGILIPFPKTRAIGALVILPIIVGIDCLNFSAQPSAIIESVIFTSVLFYILWKNRKKYLELLD